MEKLLCALIRAIILFISTICLTFDNMVTLTFAPRFYVGYARENISPRNEDGEIIPLLLGGYAGERVCENIETELYASCVAFQGETDTLALVYSLDLPSVPSEFTDSVLTTIASATSVAPENIILNAMHNHSSPAVDSAHEKNKEYRALLTEKLVSVGKAAIEDLSYCTKIYGGSATIDNLSVVRRKVTDENGKVAPEAAIDNDVPIVKFERKHDKPILLVNWAAHCDTVSSRDKNIVSSDYVGVFRDTIEQELNVHVSMQMGATADVNPPLAYLNNTPNDNRMPAYGKTLANSVLNQLSSLKEIKINNHILSQPSKIGLRVDAPSPEQLTHAKEIRYFYYSDQMDAYAQKCQEYGIENIYEATIIVRRAELGEDDVLDIRVLRVGNIAFCAAPYEMFASNGRTIKEASPFELTFIMGYSNGHKGYIPADYAIDNGGYEVYSCSYSRGSAEILQNAFIESLNSLWQSKACVHSWEALPQDDQYHLLSCTLCQKQLHIPITHSFDNTHTCTACKRHVHEWESQISFADMTLSAIGDSQTMAAHVDRAYVEILEDLLGFKETFNHGVSWSSVGHKIDCTCNHPYLPDDYIHEPFVYRYDQLEASDVIIVWGGSNDFGMGIELGTLEDNTPYTYCGAMNMLIDGIRSTYPNAFLMVMTGLKYSDSYVNKIGETWENYNRTLLELCEKKGVPCLDIYNELPFNRITDTVDYTHHSQKYANEVLAPKIAEFLDENYPFAESYPHICKYCNEIQKWVPYQNVFTDVPEHHGYICTYDLTTKAFLEKESAKHNSYVMVDVKDKDVVRLAFNKAEKSKAWSYFFYDENGKYISGGNMQSGAVNLFIEVPEGAVKMGCIYDDRRPYGIYVLERS